ncbi:MAG: hypothetical protein R3Y21_01090 [Mycoplasmatota bacterium]
MKKIMDKFIKISKTSKNYRIFFITFLIIGLLFGSIFALLISNNDSILVNEYLVSYFDNLLNNDLDILNFMISNNLNYLVIIISLWILGYSIIGIPISIFILFAKNFILGFSVCSILINYGFKGILLSLFYIIPCQLIYLFIIYILFYYSNIISKKFIKAFIKKETINFKHINNIYIYVLIICIIFNFINSILLLIQNQIIFKNLLTLLF